MELQARLSSFNFWDHHLMFFLGGGGGVVCMCVCVGGYIQPREDSSQS